MVSWLFHKVQYLNHLTSSKHPHSSPQLGTNTASGIQPHTEAVLSLEPKTVLPPHRELYLNLLFTLRESTQWGEAGHVVATGQLRLSTPRSIPQLVLHQLSSPLHQASVSPTRSGPLATTEIAPGIIQIVSATATATTWTFDLAHGHLTSWTRGHAPSNILASPLSFAIYRALTSNDAGGDDPTGSAGSQGREWRDARVHLAKNFCTMARHRLTGQRQQWVESCTADGTHIVQLKVDTRIAPPVCALSRAKHSSNFYFHT